MPCVCVVVGDKRLLFQITKKYVVKVVIMSVLDVKVLDKSAVALFLRHSIDFFETFFFVLRNWHKVERINHYMFISTNTFNESLS